LTELMLPDVPDTERLGAALACGFLWSKSAPLIMYLQGELGSGKTTLARGLLREWGIAGTVRSPTYTLLECYESMGQRVLHVDLYRVSEAADLAPLGLRDELVPGVLMLIEWPERAELLLPSPDLRITLTVAPAGHIASLQARSTTGRAWLEEALARLHPEFKRV
jgi:tRNA threonylcarbamoyladenosine biosynthesis protein TsaE